MLLLGRVFYVCQLDSCLMVVFSAMSLLDLCLLILLITERAVSQASTIIVDLSIYLSVLPIFFLF